MFLAKGQQNMLNLLINFNKIFHITKITIVLEFFSYKNIIIKNKIK